MPPSGSLALLCLLAGTVAGVPPSATAQDEVVTTTYFAFHVDPWINLHHFLYQWSRAELGLGTGRAEVVVAERDGPQPTGAPGEAWARAVAFYRENVAERDHFDLPMLTLKHGLTLLDGDPGAAPPDDIPGIAANLAAAMPVYLEHWWQEHEAADRRWVAHVVGDVRRYEERWVTLVRRAFGGEWTDGRLRVDASAYANWQGGYTSNGPPHSVVWTQDPWNLEGLYGLEMVFHESGHVSSLGGPLRTRVREAFEASGVEEPPNLRHAMLFGTAGELVRTIAEERGLPEHVPYVVAEGLAGFAGWREPWSVVEARWLPVIRSGADPLEAIEAMVRELRR